MEIRPIKPEEKILKDKIQSIAFLHKEDFEKKKDDPTQLNVGFETGRAAFDDSGKMCSCLDLIPFHVSFDSSIVPMGGIGGVASLPEEREKKYIRNIFSYVLQEMYDKGYVFSYLYPFSHKYYRKFGYELNMINNTYSIPVSAFRQFEQTGSLRLYTNDLDPHEIITLYGQFIKDKNLAVVRTEKLWKRFLEKDPYKDNVYLYIWYNKQGDARGYIQFHTEKEVADKNTMRVHELIWLDRDALTGIFSFISALTAQIETMVWNSPSYVNLLPLFHEPYDIKQETTTYGMNRIVNVEKALNLMSLHEGSGEITLDIRDEFFPINSGNYRIKWENETRTVEKAEDRADLSCDVQALSQLMTGFASIDELKLAGRVDVKKNEQLLSRIFTKKKLFISNYF
jgi:predicted acetyltransferase